MIQNRIGRFADRDPPEVLTRVHIDGCDAAVGRLEDIQAIRTTHAKAAQYRVFSDGRSGGRLDERVTFGARRDDSRRAVLS